MVPMAIVTCWSRKVVLNKQSLPMDALLVLRKLICRDMVTCHIRSIRVTAGTGAGNIGRINGGLCLIDREDTMYPVATDTGGDLFVTPGESLSVPAGFILSLLICSKLLVKVGHIRFVAVATAAEPRNFLFCH